MINFERLIYMRQPFLRKVLTGILMRELSQRTSQFTDSVIRRMTRVANKYGAVNLSQGFPDFDPPEAITDRLAEVAGEGPHQYALTWGAKNFRDALAAKQEHFSGMKIDAESEIVVTCGSTEAMMAAMMSVVNPGDKVIIFSPFYENYGADTILSGAEPVYVPLVPPEFKFDANVLEDAFKTGAKALILCNPSNPCGKVFTEGELKIISELAIKYDTYVITDEVYEHIIYEPNKHIYISTLPGMRERTIVINGFSKAFAMTGWRLGYACAPKNIMTQMIKLHQFAIMCAPTNSQFAAVEAMRNCDDEVGKMVEAYDQRRRFLLNAFKEMGIECFEPYGAFYVFPSIKKFGMTSDEFANRLLFEQKLAVVPGTAFGASGEGFVRISYAYSVEKLKAGLERIENFIKNL